MPEGVANPGLDATKFEPEPRRDAMAATKSVQAVVKRPVCSCCRYDDRDDAEGETRRFDTAHYQTSASRGMFADFYVSRKDDRAVER